MPYLFTNKSGIGYNSICRIFIFLAVIMLLAGCSRVSTTSRSGSESLTSPIALPTQAPTLEPTPPNTRVLPVEVLTPQPKPTITPIPDEVTGLITNVIDGDTLAVVLDGDRARQAYTVRLLGIDAPDNISNTPWGIVAYENLKKLAELKIVRLVRDQTDFDADGYLLRYVYLDDQLLNATLVEQGLARAAIEAPDTRFETAILAAESRARAEQLGLWNPQPPTPTAGASPAAGAGEAEPTTQANTATISATVTLTSTIQATGEATPEATTEPTEESTPQNN